jgi:hypothetical protein
MKKLLTGLAALPFLAGIALAGQPMQLTSTQMDQVTAGFSLDEVDNTNTSWTLVSAYEFPAVIQGIPSTDCPNGCYLDIATNGLGLSVAAQFGPRR